MFMEHEHTLFLSSSNCIHRRCASLSCVRSIDLPWSRMHACGWMDVCIPRYIGGKEAFIVWNSAELQNCRIAELHDVPLLVAFLVYSMPNLSMLRERCTTDTYVHWVDTRYTLYHSVYALSSALH